MVYNGKVIGIFVVLPHEPRFQTNLNKGHCPPGQPLPRGNSLTRVHANIYLYTSSTFFHNDMQSFFAQCRSNTQKSEIGRNTNTHHLQELEFGPAG